ncbi:MAG: hypothetical protein ABI655_05950 [Phenylobacterium sp.]
MKFEVVESGGEWIVQHQGVEVARFAKQALALTEVARLLREAPVSEAGASLAMRYQARTA